jgi:transposase
MDDAPCPPCPGCTQRDREIDDLKKRVADLEKRLDEAARGRKRQTAPFSKGLPRKDAKKPGRKAGPEHGPHAHRPPLPPEAVQEVLEAPLPDACPHCGGELREDDDIDEQFQIDLPVQPVRRKFRIRKGSCKTCGQRVRGRHPLQTSDAVGAAQSQTGPGVQAGIVYLNKRSGMSYGKIADFFRVACGIDLRPSTCTRIVLRAAQRLEPTYERIKESVKNSKVITPDETGWREGGRSVWLHGAVGDEATCYFIDRKRSADALEKIIGLDYSGILNHDGFASYDRFEDAMHQACVAHPMRRAHALEETLQGRNKRFPRQVIDLFQEALELREACLPLWRVGRFDAEVLAEAHEDFVDRLLDLTAGPRAHELNRKFANHLRRHAPEWFLFVLDPEVPATNFRAEQALRTPIVNRKVFGGNRTAAGCEAQAITSSTIETCKQQKRSPFAFLRDVFCGIADALLPQRPAASAAAPA